MLRAKVDKNYRRTEQTSPPKTQTSFIPSPQEEEETAMPPIFLKSSLPITVSESDTTSHGLILLQNHLRANLISSQLISIICKFIAHKLQDKGTWHSSGNSLNQGTDSIKTCKCLGKNWWLNKEAHFANFKVIGQLTLCSQIVNDPLQLQSFWNPQ